MHLNDIEEYLHYRSVDVSSVKELVRRWYPDVLARRGWKQGSHRALDDIRENTKAAGEFDGRPVTAESLPVPMFEELAGNEDLSRYIL